MSDTELPEYDSPPVVEVALTVQFEDSFDMGEATIDALAGAWPEYALERRAVLRTIGLEPSHIDRPEAGAELERLWMSAKGGQQVVQVQHDRLTVNWKRDSLDETYPRFTWLRKFFLDAWHRLSKITAIDLCPDICQVLYVNHIGAESGWHGISDTSEILASWRGHTSDEFLPEPEIAAAYLHYHIPDPGQWLDIDVGPIRPDENADRVLAMYVSSRGWAATADLDGALAVLDVAHEWIVRGFTSATTAKAHQKWGRTR
ncbi:TIGR04255 family protein [Candidatus Poriferisodalis sp.]|uniref:TIGR04255 family protein n=1 Tax=Candidatus Poriferisodalis sp. TaxID=3101277 RepID=UPI003B025E04